MTNYNEYNRGKYSDFSRQRFQKTLKDFRELRHMTQSDLARAVGVTPATISAYENSTREPSTDMYYKLATVLKIDPIEFFTHDYVSLYLGKSSQQLRDLDLNTQRDQDTFLRENQIQNIIRNLSNLPDEDIAALERIVDRMNMGAELAKDYRTNLSY